MATKKQKEAQAGAKGSLMEPITVPVESLTPDPDNARKHPEENIEAIKASLREFGQRRPVVVQRSGMIVRAGNGLLQAAKEMGWEEITAIVIDEDDAKAIAFAIADNRTGELSEWDERQLNALLEQVEADADDLIEAVGFSEAKRNNLKARYGEAGGEADKAKKEDVGTKSFSVTFAAPDYERFRAALDYLQSQYAIDTQEQLILTIVEHSAEAFRTGGPPKKKSKVDDVQRLIEGVSGDTDFEEIDFDDEEGAGKSLSDSEIETV